MNDTIQVPRKLLIDLSEDVMACLNMAKSHCVPSDRLVATYEEELKQCNRLLGAYNDSNK